MNSKPHSLSFYSATEVQSIIELNPNYGNGLKQWTLVKLQSLIIAVGLVTSTANSTREVIVAFGHGDVTRHGRIIGKYINAFVD